jgi:uncharacterized protein YcfJ
VGSGADRRIVDLFARDAGGSQLIDIRAAQGQHRAVAGTWQEPATNVIGGVAGASERLHDLGTDLAAALTQARPDGGNEIARAGAEVSVQRRYRRRCRALHRAAPACVDGSDDAQTCVGEEHGRTVRDADADGGQRVIAHDRVRLRRRPGFIAPAARDGDARAMNLANQPKPERIHAEGVGDRDPFSPIAAELQIARRKEVLAV